MLYSTQSRLLRAAALSLALSCTAISSALAATPCDRACLKQITDQYFDALAAHSISGLPLAAKLKYTENGKQLKLGEGLWKTAGKTTYRMDAFDPETGGVGVSAVIAEAAQPVILMQRLKVDDGKISEAEAIVVRKGDAGVLWAPDKLTKPSQHFTRTIRVAEQDSRFELLAAADAYFRLLNHTRPSIPLHLADDSTIELRASPEFSVWVIWTLGGKDFVCLEPWTAPGNAMNSGERLMTLEPGRVWQGWMEIEFIKRQA